MAIDTTKQDPNTPRYNQQTGTLTDYGKYLGLKEVNPTTINSDILNKSNTQTKLPEKTTDTSYNNVNSLTNSYGGGSEVAFAEDLKGIKEKYDKTSEIANIMREITDTTSQQANIEESLGANESLKAYKKFSTDIQKEDENLRQAEERILRENPTQALRGGQSDLLTGLRRESANRKAIMTIERSAALGDYETAINTAKAKVEMELAPKKAELERLQFIYDNNKPFQTVEIQSLLDRKSAELADEKKKKETIQAYKVEAIKGGFKNYSAFDTIETVDDALKLAAPFMATSDNQIVELANGNTVVVDKKTGRVINNLGGGKAPTTVLQTVAGKPVTGYTMVEGDDPYFIAQQHGITVDELKRLNPKITDWTKIPVGATLNVPQAPEEAFTTYLKGTEGGKALTDTSIQKLDKGLTVLGQLGTLQANVKGVKTGPITGAFKSANPWSTEGQTIKASLNAIVPNLARGVYGEVGVLTDNDIKTYSQTIPNLKSTEEVRNAVLYITLDMIGKSIKNTLTVNAAAGRDVSGFVDIYTEMEATKNSILQQIPGAQVPQAFNKKVEDPFLSQFSPDSISSSINNSDFFNQLP